MPPQQRNDAVQAAAVDAKQAARSGRKVTVSAPDLGHEKTDDSDEDVREARTRARSRWGSMFQHMDDGKNVVDLTSKRQSAFKMHWRHDDEDDDEEDEED